MSEIALRRLSARQQPARNALHLGNGDSRACNFSIGQARIVSARRASTCGIVPVVIDGEPAVIDLERSAYLLTGFAVMGLMAVGAYWVFSLGSHSSLHRGVVVTLKQPQVICRSADSVRHKEESGSQDDDVVLPRILLRECRKVEAGIELTVEEIGPAVTRVREKDALASAYASTDDIMANVPAVASK